MRVLNSIFCLFCAFIPLVVRGASIDKSAEKDEKTKEQSLGDGKVASTGLIAANDTAASEAGAEVDFVSGPNVANFSGKTQNQIFNQIVPLANVKDFYDHHHPHNHHYWDYRHYFNHPHPHHHHDHDSHIHHYKYAPSHHSYHHETKHHHKHYEPKTVHHKSKHIYHQSIHKPDKVHYHKHRYHVHKHSDHDYQTKQFHHKEPSHHHVTHDHENHGDLYYKHVTAPAIHDEGAILEKWEPKWEQKWEPKWEPKGESKWESKWEPKWEPKVESKWEPKWEEKWEPKWEPKVDPKWEPTKYGSEYKKVYRQPNPKQHVDWLGRRNAAKKFDDGQYRPEHHFTRGGWKQRRSNNDEELGELSFASTGSENSGVTDLKDWAEALSAAKNAAKSAFGKDAAESAFDDNAAETAPWREEDDWQIDAEAWQRKPEQQENKWPKRDNDIQWQNQNKWPKRANIKWERKDAPKGAEMEAEREVPEIKEPEYRNADYYFDDRLVNGE